MLSRILHLMRQSPEPLCADAIAGALEKELAVVQPMLDELVSIGHLNVGHEESVCDGCQLKSLCALPPGSGPLYSA